MNNNDNNDHIYRVLFEMASQMRFRYPLKGRSLTTEDLWDLSPADLDLIYISLQKELMDLGACSLIPTGSADNGVEANEIRNKMRIVEYIFQNDRLARELKRIASKQ